MTQTLIIVESPGKARTVGRIARQYFQARNEHGQVWVSACFGHIRDLAGDSLQVDIAHGFKPLYTIKSASVVGKLRQAIRQADRVILACDPDREGEAIAWHIWQVFKDDLQGKTFHRCTFAAITPQAIEAGLQKPRSLNIPLVQAAIARRVVDRLIGFWASPRLWQAVAGRNLSAGRVQTAALRLLIEEVDRRAAARTPETWTVEIGW